MTIKKKPRRIAASEKACLQNYEGPSPQITIKAVIMAIIPWGILLKRSAKWTLPERIAVDLCWIDFNPLAITLFAGGF